MVVYIQKKVDGKWRTILSVNQERAHRVCRCFMKYSPVPELRIVENSEAD
jgi:hypothetical protein